MRRPVLYILASFTVAASLLSGCGFAPLHAPQGTFSSQAPLRAMDVELNTASADKVTGERVNYLLRQKLTDRMASGQSDYALSITSRLSRTALGVTADDVTSRYDLSLSANYVLINALTKEVLGRETLYAVSTFNVPADPYGRVSAQNDAEDRVASDISDQLVFKLARHLNNAK